MKIYKRKSLLVISVIFSFFNIYVYMLEHDLLNFNLDYCIMIFNIFLLTFVIYMFFQKIIEPMMELRHSQKQEVFCANTEKTYFQYFLKVCIIQIICWLPVFLAYYPGLFAYDVMSQIPQQMGSYNSHHPLIHTLYLQFFYYFIGGDLFKNYNTGIALATITQMIVFSAMISYVHLYLFSINVKKSIRYLLIALVSLLPEFSMLAISMTKDTFFAGSVGLLITGLGYECKNSEVLEKVSLHKVIYIFAIILTILFRNNGIYPVIVLAGAILVQSIIKKRYRFFIQTLLGIVLGMIISLMLQNGLNASKGSLNEALNLPYQQIACAYMENKDTMSTEDIDAVFKIIPDVERYNPHISDPIKFTAHGDIYLKDLIGLYLKFLMKYFNSYLRAFSNLNAGYLGLSDVSFAEIYGTTSRQGIFLTDTKEGFNITHHTYLPWIENLYEYLYTSNKYEMIIGLNILCSPAFYFWIMVSFMLYGIAEKGYDIIPIVLFMTTFLLTLLAGPCVLSRYALPYIISIPVVGTCALESNIKSTGG